MREREKPNIQVDNFEYTACARQDPRKAGAEARIMRQEVFIVFLCRICQVSGHLSLRKGECIPFTFVLSAT